jgi:hypothetical protein
MSNSNVHTNATAWDDDGEDVFPRSQVDIALTVFALTVFGFCSAIVIFASIYGFCRRLGLSEEVVSLEAEEERRRQRKEFVSNGLIVKEWVPDDPPFESSTEGVQDTPPSDDTVEAPQPPAPPINLSPTSCALGSDDCESLAGEEDMAGCAICLSHFKPQELVCESNNSSCQHVFHKDCMIDWLMKHHKNCPMCREIYLLKTV